MGKILLFTFMFAVVVMIVIYMIYLNLRIKDLKHLIEIKDSNNIDVEKKIDDALKNNRLKIIFRDEKCRIYNHHHVHTVRDTTTGEKYICIDLIKNGNKKAKVHE